MTAKTSISLTDAQERFARELVECGRYSSLSAVLQHGLELLRTQKETEEIETAALRALLEERRRGKFVSVRSKSTLTDRIVKTRKSSL